MNDIINLYRDFEEYDRFHHRRRYDFVKPDTSTPQGQAYANYKAAREAFTSTDEKMRRFSEYLSLNRYKLEILENSFLEHGGTVIRGKLETEAYKAIKKAFDKFMRDYFQ